MKFSLINVKYLYFFTLLMLAIPNGLAQNKTTIEGDLAIAKDMFVIVMERPITAKSDFGESKTSNRVMIISQTSEQAEKMKHIVGMRVRATGNLGAALTGHHTEPLFISIDAIPEVIVKSDSSKNPERAITPPPGSKLRKGHLD
jgi:hypothetical protein